ncbi:hypothetical protein [Pseudomonas sp. JV241A]|uniref:hypothetical protein n=1 Tax=Pseudomonas sp. JV241A TaxID=2078785 RepID=UPI00100CAFC4|nr:hypothetical protein [Pseudomonas sp. JV241A]SPO67443.1 conserved protein of unknown function [Pseudomonas sp. JV241A]
MPTENRSSNTEQTVSVPEGYMLVERSIWTEQQVEAATACITRLKVVPGMRDRDLAMAAIDAAQCKAPDVTLADLQAVARLDELDCKECEGAQRLCWSCNAAAQHQGKPVAYLVTDVHGQKKALRAGAEGIERHRHSGSTLVPLYTHADAGEVQRLRKELLAAETQAANHRAERDTQNTKLNGMRAQLAERDALLRGTSLMLKSIAHKLDGFHRDFPGQWCGYLDRALGGAEYQYGVIEAALSDSEEPSAPVEHDQGIPGTSFQRLSMLANQGE